MHPQPNSLPQPQHLRRESSQSAHSDMSSANMNRGYAQNSGRGGRSFGGPQHQHYQQMPAQSPQMYNARPHQQHMGGRGGMAPAFQPQGPMQQNSPYRQNRSPAITPATMHQQQQYVNGPYYPGQPAYPQPVRITSTISNLPSVSEISHQAQPTTAPRPSRKDSKSTPFRSADMKELDFRVLHDTPNAFLDVLESPFSSTTILDHDLTKIFTQNMYGGPPPMYEQNMYGTGYGLAQSMHYPGAIPGSPSRVHGFPQQMPGPYGVPGYQPQAQGMSRTPSNMSERPGSAVPQPSTPAMTNVNHISHTPGMTAASPAPSSTFERPKKRSAAILIKNRKFDPSYLKVTDTDTQVANDGSVIAPNVKVAASPALAPAAAPTQPRSPAIAATPTPPPRAPSAANDAAKAEELKAEFQRKVRESQAEPNKQAKDSSDATLKADAEAKQKAEEEAKQKAEQDAKEKEEAATADKEKEKASAADKANADAEEQKRLADEETERMIAEMEAEEAKREAEEEKYAAEKKEREAAKKAKEAEDAKNEDERLKQQERDAEAAEIARENQTPEQKAEIEAQNKKLFAGLAKNTTLGPGANAAEATSGESTPAEVAEPTAPTPTSAKLPSSKSKPSNLKLDMNKTIEPAQPTAGMQSLKSARFLQVRSELVNYPEGILSPNPALNASTKNKGRTYDKDFLLQFQDVFKEKPSTDWDLKLKETVGDGTDSARPSSARTPSTMGGRSGSSRGGPPGGAMGAMGNFTGGRTLPPGTTSQQRFEQASGSGRSMTNPLAHVVMGGGRGGFAMGAPMARQGSYQPMPGPNSPRNASSRGKGGSRRGPPGKNEAQEAKSMPLTAGQTLKELDRSQTGWKPMSLTSSAPQQSAGHMAPDMVQRKVKSNLNKMTPEKFDKISSQILEIAAQSKDETDGRTLRQVIQLTFEKACDESHWSSMYANFCNRMLQTMSTDIKDENVKDKHGNPVVGGALFRKYLLNRCQEEFERGWQINLPEAPEEGKEITMLTDEYYVAAAAKRKGLGLIQFIGELYKLGMLTLRIMHECVLKLLDFEGLPDESAIESLVKLLRTVGQTMEGAEAGPKMINMYFERIEKVMNMDGLPSRLKFMLLDTIDMRRSGWKSKDILKGPKTITEIHQEAQAAAQAAEMERARSNQRGGGGGGGRMPMGRGDARSFSGGGMMPPPDTGSRVQMDDLRKLSKGASGRNMNTGAALGPSMLGSRSGSGRRGLGPGMMGGRDDSNNSSRNGTPPVQKEKESTAHANAFR